MNVNVTVDRFITCIKVRVLANIVAKDVRTTTARNLRLLEEETEGLTWVASNLRVKDMLMKGIWAMTYLSDVKTVLLVQNVLELQRQGWFHYKRGWSRK